MAMTLNNIGQEELVTIITAVRNGDPFIEDAIQSVFKQSYTNVEYFVIDGASTDQTNEIVKKYESKIHWYISEKDNGLADAWNKGIARASGKYIALLNADDFYDVDFILRSVEKLRSNPNCVTFGTTVLIDPKTGFSQVNRPYFSKEKIGKGFGFLHTSCVVPMLVYRAVGGFDTQYKIGMDTDFLLRCLNNNINLVESKAVNYMREGGISGREVIKSRDEYRKSLRSHGFYDSHWVQDMIQVCNLRIQSIVGSSLKAKVLSQLRFFLLFCFTAFYNNCSSHSLRRLLLKKTGTTIGFRSLIHPRAKFFSFGRIKIGNGTIICSDCYIDNRNAVTIGNDVMIAHGCRIYTTGHALDCPYFRGIGKPVTIGNRAVLFANATLMPGVTIGEGSVVLSNAVVTRDVEPYDVVGGNPARRLRVRSKDLRYCLDYAEYFAI